MIKNKDYTRNKKCVCCNSSKLNKVLDLGKQPLANSNLINKYEKENYYPLAINFCEKCTHLQLTHTVNPDLLFRNYLYVTGTSQTMRDYLKWFADYSLELVPKAKNILDIACNDGTLLDIYKDMGIETYGIDPSENLYAISSENHYVLCDYLNYSHAKIFNNKFDIITAQNVFAHTSYPEDFLKMCKQMVTEDGLIFIQTSQANMIKNNEFDTIYHEHISFFSAESFKTLAKRVGLTVVKIEKTSVHGQSYLFTLSRNPKAVESNYKDDLELNKNVINNYVSNIKRAVKDLKDNLTKIESEGYKIIGYGSAAKGNTLLNYAKIDFDYIIDDNPLKQGLFTPGRRIEILPSSKLSEEKGKVCIVPLAWNYFDEILKNCNENLVTKERIFVKYFPVFEVLNG